MSDDTGWRTHAESNRSGSGDDTEWSLDHDTGNQDDKVRAWSTGIDNTVQSNVVELTEEEPQTIRELVNTVGEEHNLTRDQVEYRMDKLSDAGIVNQKKGAGRTSPKIYWRD